MVEQQLNGNKGANSSMYPQINQMENSNAPLDLAQQGLFKIFKFI